MAKQILKEGILYALLIHTGEIDHGLQFYTDESSYLQVSTWKYKKGKLLHPHAHQIYARKSNLTQEFVYVKKGSLKVTIYDRADQIIASEILKEDDVIILFTGGHGYNILEDDTEVIEVKNGPYPGLEKDKRLIS